MKKQILAVIAILVLFATTACKEETPILKSSKPTVEEPILTKVDDFSKTIIKGKVPGAKDIASISFEIKGEKAIAVKTDNLGVFQIEIDTPDKSVKAILIATEPNKSPSDPLEITISPAHITATPVVEMPIVTKDSDPSKLILKGAVEGAKNIVTLTLDIEGKEPISFKSDDKGVFEVEIDAPESDTKAKLTAVELYKVPSSTLEIVIPKALSSDELDFARNKSKYYAFRGVYEEDTKFTFQVTYRDKEPYDSIFVVVEEMNANEVLKRDFYIAKPVPRLRNAIDRDYRAARVYFKIPAEFVGKDIIVYTKGNHLSRWVKGLKKILNYGEDVFVLHYRRSDSFEIEAQLTEKTTNIASIFSNAKGEKYPGIEKWDTKNVKLASGMFAGAMNFNQDLPNWDLREVSAYENLDDMFLGAESFNGDISGWRVDGVGSMSNMFCDAKKFNGDISKWEVSSVTNMLQMFKGAESFNSDISGWKTRSLNRAADMFKDAKSFNQNIGNWDMSNVAEMNGMFAGAESFNQDISKWNLKKVVYASSVFWNAKSFNQDISGWEFSPKVKDMLWMFNGAESFNQDISKWDVSNVEKMEGMFQNAKSFSYDLSGWNVEKVTDYTDFNKGATLLTDDKCPKWKK